MFIMRDIDELQKTYNHWVDEILRGGTQARESKWTEALLSG